MPVLFERSRHRGTHLALTRARLGARKRRDDSIERGERVVDG
jgi:hypothetical protein